MGTEMKQSAYNTQITRYQYTALCLVTVLCEAFNKIILSVGCALSLFKNSFYIYLVSAMFHLVFSNKGIICGLLDFE